MKDAPSKEEVENFWTEIYGEKVLHNEEACWIKDRHQRSPSMEWSQVCEKGVVRCTKNNAKLENPWKRPDTKFLA